MASSESQGAQWVIFLQSKQEVWRSLDEGGRKPGMEGLGSTYQEEVKFCKARGGSPRIVGLWHQSKEKMKTESRLELCLQCG